MAEASLAPISPTEVSEAKHPAISSVAHNSLVTENLDTSATTYPVGNDTPTFPAEFQFNMSKPTTPAIGAIGSTNVTTGGEQLATPMATTPNLISPGIPDAQLASSIAATFSVNIAESSSGDGDTNVASALAATYAPSVVTTTAVSESRPDSVTPQIGAMAGAPISIASSSSHQVPTASSPPTATTTNAAKGTTRKIGSNVRVESVGKKKVRKTYFTRELKRIMYGYGDVQEPQDNSVLVLEDLVCDYIANVTSAAAMTAKRRGQIKVEDILFYLRNDRKKYARVKDMLIQHEKIRKARRPFEPPKEETLATNYDDETKPGTKDYA